jgi:hypothetical protein
MDDRTKIRNLLFQYYLSPEKTDELHALLRGMTEITFDAHDNLQTRGLMRLAEALRKEDSTVTSLQLSNILLGHSEVNAIANVLKNPDCKLTKLRLSFNQITDKGAIAIADALKSPNCRLILLHIQSYSLVGMGDSGVKAITDALKNPYCKLESLNLSRINDDRAFLIADALKSPHCKLTSLGLSNNDIRDDGAIAIADALKSPHCRLILLDMQNNQLVSMRGKNAIANALKVNMTLTTFRPSFRNGDQKLSLNRMIKNLFFTFFVQENAQKGFGSDVVKKDLIPHFSEDNFNNDAWDNLYWEEMKNISSLSRFVNYLDNQDRIDVRKKIKRRILFLKRNKIINHVPAQLNERVQNALYRDIRNSITIKPII